MFLDASAVVGILGGEPDAGELMARLDNATTRPTTSPVAIMESVLGLRRAKGISIDDAEDLVEDFMRVLGARNVAITPEIGKRAIRARARYGRPHKADLNLGDCFAYACAQNYAVPLLYSGNDFSLTDLG
jgi:ribonuclease VapC